MNGRFLPCCQLYPRCHHVHPHCHAVQAGTYPLPLWRGWRELSEAKFEPGEGSLSSRGDRPLTRVLASLETTLSHKGRGFIVTATRADCCRRDTTGKTAGIVSISACKNICLSERRARNDEGVAIEITPPPATRPAFFAARSRTRPAARTGSWRARPAPRARSGAKRRHQQW